MKTLIAIAILLLSSVNAAAGSVNPGEGRHFVAVASAKDLDEAIGIARLYGDQVQVVSSQSGWYGVVLGPVGEPSLKAFRKAYQGWPEIPADAVWSKGDNYIDSVWSPDTATPKAIELSEAAAVQTGDEAFQVTATVTRTDDKQTVRLVGEDNGTPAFDLSTPEDYYADFAATIRLGQLDPATPAPEVLVTQYTGGAHCCVASWFASRKADGTWALTDGAMLDGGGYWLEKVDDDQAYELLSVDNAFLYAFDAYAGSFATIEIQQLRNGTVIGMPKTAQWRSRIAQDLAGKEFLAKLDPSLWQSNGFLPAWVATKIMLGEGDAAWEKMLANYDRNSDFGPQICTTGQPVEDCPAENLKPVPFPEALAVFLRENGYTPVPGG